MKKVLKILFLLFFLGGTLFIFFKSDFFRVKKIICRWEGDSCPPEIWNELTFLTFGKNLIFLKKEEISKKFLKSHQVVKNLKIKKVLPNKLVFELERRKEVAVLGFELKLEDKETTSSGKPIFETTKDFFLVDEEGVVVKKENNNLLPLILLSEELNLNIGQKVPKKEIVEAIKFLTNLRLNLLEPKVAKITSPYSLSVWLEDGKEALFSLKKEIQVQVDSLQFILSRSKIEGRKIKKIDLRFDKPVVNYE
jgi:cell division septal protein FtsQ